MIERVIQKESCDVRHDALHGQWLTAAALAAALAAASDAALAAASDAATPIAAAAHALAAALAASAHVLCNRHDELDDISRASP